MTLAFRRKLSRAFQVRTRWRCVHRAEIRICFFRYRSDDDLGAVEPLSRTGRCLSLPSRAVLYSAKDQLHGGLAMTGVFHHTQAGEVAETWSMSSSVLLQTESINIEVFSRSTELRGEVLESQQRLSELHRELMRATTKEERERENYPIPEAERITRLALNYFGGPEEVEIDSAVNDLFRRVVAEFAKQEGEHRDELERSRRQTERAGTRFLTELERHVKTFTPVDQKRGPVTYFALDPGWLQVRGRLPGADLAEPDSGDAYIFEPAEVIRRFVQSAVASFDVTPKEATTLADELYSVLEKMPIRCTGRSPNRLNPSARG